MKNEVLPDESNSCNFWDRGAVGSMQTTNEVQHNACPRVVGTRLSTRRLSCFPLLWPWISTDQLQRRRIGWLWWDADPNGFPDSRPNCRWWYQFHNCETSAGWCYSSCHCRCLSQWHSSGSSISLQIQWVRPVTFVSHIVHPFFIPVISCKALVTWLGICRDLSTGKLIVL